MEKKIKVLKQQFCWLKFLSTLGSGWERGMMNKCRPTILTIILFSHLTKSKEYEIPAIIDEQEIRPDNLKCLFYAHRSRSLEQTALQKSLFQ
jgi:hypothetical protein